MPLTSRHKLINIVSIKFKTKLQSFKVTFVEYIGCVHHVVVVLAALAIAVVYIIAFTT
jgi:hypothetical protein